MLEASRYFDFCVEKKCIEDDHYSKTITKLYELGYRTIAINYLVNENCMEPKKKKKKGQSADVADIVPKPIEIVPVKGAEDMKILNRLTIEFGNQDCIHKILKSANFKKFDIVAALPTTQAALSFTCNNLEADIFTFNPENKFNFKFNRKIYNQLLDRGYHFELMYGPMIEDRSKRQNIIQIAHMYHALGKSKNIIVTSSTDNPFLFRNPYDVMNLGLILGLKEGQSKYSVGVCGRNTFLHSVSRKHSKSVVYIITEPTEAPSPPHGDPPGLLPSSSKMEDDPEPSSKRHKH